MGGGYANSFSGKKYACYRNLWRIAAGTATRVCCRSQRSWRPSPSHLGWKPSYYSTHCGTSRRVVCRQELRLWPGAIGAFCATQRADPLNCKATVVGARFLLNVCSLAPESGRPTGGLRPCHLVLRCDDCGAGPLFIWAGQCGEPGPSSSRVFLPSANSIGGHRLRGSRDAAKTVGCHAAHQSTAPRSPSAKNVARFKPSSLRPGSWKRAARSIRRKGVFLRGFPWRRERAPSFVIADPRCTTDFER